MESRAQLDLLDALPNGVRLREVKSSSLHGLESTGGDLSDIRRRDVVPAGQQGPPTLDLTPYNRSSTFTCTGMRIQKQFPPCDSL